MPVHEPSDDRKASAAALVVNWNGGNIVLEAIRSLIASDGVALHVLVIDNDSHDGSCDEIGREFPQIEIRRNPSNVGAASAFAQGVTWARSQNEEFLFLLNPDAAVRPDCLFRLRQTLVASDDAAACTPRILDETKPGRVWYDGGYFTSGGIPLHRDMGALQAEERGRENVDFFTGCAVLLRVAMVQEIGSFDERFFAYGEDTDLSLRLRSSGHTLLHDPSAQASHAPSALLKSNAGKWLRDYYVVRNAFLLRKLHRNGGLLSLSSLTAVWYYVARPIVFFLLTAQFKRVAAVGRGVLDFGRGRFGEYPHDR